MGKAIKGASIKVEGEAGPLGKGMPVTQAAGPIQGSKSLNDRANASASATGVALSAAGAAPGQQPMMGTGMGVPNTGGGYAQSKKNWLQQRQQQGNFQNSFFGRMAAKNPAMKKRFQTAFDAKQQKQKYGGMGGMFRRALDKKQMQTPGQPMGNPVGHAGTPGVAELPPPTTY